MEFLFEIFGEILTCFWIGDGKEQDTKKGCLLIFGFILVFLIVLFAIIKIYPWP